MMEIIHDMITFIKAAMDELNNDSLTILDVRMQNETRHCHSPYTKIISKWNKDQNLKSEHVGLL
jgi:hypothetical protein